MMPTNCPLFKDDPEKLNGVKVVTEVSKKDIKNMKWQIRALKKSS